MLEPNKKLCLRQVIEIGRCWIADYTSEFRLFVDVPIEQVQDVSAVPLAILPASREAWAVANLLAALIAEAYPTGVIDLPAWFNKDLKYAAEILADSDPGETGNVGTVSDNIEIKLLDSSGREFN